MPPIPQYILDHAPLLHLHPTDPYRPSSLSTHLSHTQPLTSSFKPLPNSPTPLSLSNLALLNDLGGKEVYLTSKEDVTTAPGWLEGVKENGDGDEEEEGKRGVIVVVPKGEVEDVFYFYFWSFNFGGVVLGRELGDHVGDWEHNMIRFRNGVPEAVWLSQHANGEAYTFSCVKKDDSGKRPIFFAAKGTHAIYATPGTHDHTIPNLNLPTPLLLVDETEAGPLYDPLKSSYYYTYTGGRFTAVEPTSTAPTSFLEFVGRWGDQEYPADDERQKGKNLFSFKKYVSGPTGPVDKRLDRKEVWPENEFSKGQRIRTKLGLSFWEKVKSDVKGLKCFGKKDKVTRVKASGEVIT